MDSQKRKYLIFLVIAFLVCTTRESFGQNQINISYQQTCAKCVQFFLKIDIKKNQSDYKIKVKYQLNHQLDIDTSFSITAIQFEQAINSIKKISSADIIENIDFMGKDGGTSTIDFSSFANNISYSIWEPTYDTSKRKLTSFVDACKQIIKLANLNPEEILR